MTWSEGSRRRDSNPESPDYKTGAIRLIGPLPATLVTPPPQRVPDTAPVDSISRHEPRHARAVIVRMAFV